MDIQTSFGIVVGAGVIIAGIGYAYSQFFKGKRTQEDDVLEKGSKTLKYVDEQLASLQSLVEIQKDRVNSLESQIREMGEKHSKEVAELKILIQEKDKKIDEFIAIFQNRNPQLETFMSSTTSAIDHVKTGVDKLVGAMQVTIK